MAETSKSTTKEKAAKTKKETHKEQEKLLNRELEDSFPASDPPSLTQPTTEMGGSKRSKARAETDPGAAFTTAALLDKRASNPQGAPRKRRVAGAVGDSSTVEQQNSDSVNLGSNPGPPTTNPPDITAYSQFPRSPEKS